jgi:hypothetical protein
MMPVITIAATVLAVAAPAPPMPSPTPKLSLADRQALQGYGCRSPDSTLLVQCALGTMRVHCRSLERDLLGVQLLRPAAAQTREALAKARACIGHADGFSASSSWKAAHDSLKQAERLLLQIKADRTLAKKMNGNSFPPPERFDPLGPPAQRLAQMKEFCKRQSTLLEGFARDKRVSKLKPREQTLFNDDLALGRTAVRNCDTAAAKGWSSATSMANEAAGAVNSSRQLLLWFPFWYASCPPEMASIDGRYCIDKWEAVLNDRITGQGLSPFFTPNADQKSPHSLKAQYAKWVNRPAKNGAALPYVPQFELTGNFELMAVSQYGSVPQGFMNRPLAAAACANANKRLCNRNEWYKACVGPGVPVTPGSFPVAFPYGKTYVRGKCNFNVVPGHPLYIVGRSSSELDDPRLMEAELKGKRLLEATGLFSQCTNGYGVFDMVGNQDEIVSDTAAGGANMIFVGSFYSRDQSSTGPQGCASAVPAHSAAGYYDYSIGFRCCKDL